MLYSTTRQVQLDMRQDQRPFVTSRKELQSVRNQHKQSIGWSWLLGEIQTCALLFSHTCDVGLGQLGCTLRALFGCTLRALFGCTSLAQLCCMFAPLRENGVGLIFACALS
jgi:hypothetical protein